MPVRESCGSSGFGCRHGLRCACGTRVRRRQAIVRGRQDCGENAAEGRVFQSAPPARGATAKLHRKWLWVTVSIRAPRAGGDGSPLPLPRRGRSFNPRPPRGGRLGAVPGFRRVQVFQSAPPARGATIAKWLSVSRGTFQSAPPARGATHDLIDGVALEAVSIRAPRAGGDLAIDRPPRQPAPVSIRAPRAGGDVMSAAAACWIR